MAVPVNGAVTVEEARSLATGTRDVTQSGYIYTDLRGSTLARTGWDAQMSLPFEEAEYGAWGETLSISANPAPTHQFVGFEPDPATGWYFMGARVYDPTLRRWLSPDPLLLAAPQVDAADGQELNLYAYGRNNPVVRIDPDGTFTFLTGIPYHSYLQDKFAKTTDATATVVVETVVVGTVYAALGCNPANAPGLGEKPQAPNTFFEEAVELGTMGKFGGGGRAAGRFFTKHMDDVAGSAAKSNSKRAAASTSENAAKQTEKVRKLWKIERYDKAGNHPGVGQVYKDGKTLWVDLKGGHADAQWKIYEQKGGSWELQRSADKYGKFLDKKHESGKYDIIRDKDISWTKGK